MLKQCLDRIYTETREVEAHVYNFKVNDDMFTSGQTVNVNVHKHSIHSNSMRVFFWFKYADKRGLLV